MKKWKNVEKINFSGMNLWNVSSDNKHKTRYVIEYIEGLQPYNFWNYKLKNEFLKLKDLALSKNTPDEMLEVIGYTPKNGNKIYDWVQNEK